MLETCKIQANINELFRRGEWRIAKISKTIESDDGYVRNCELQYKQIQPVGTYSKKFTTIKRSVHRIIVLVPVDENNNV